MSGDLIIGPSLKTIDNSAFYNCSSLDNIIVENINAAYSMSVFEGCNAVLTVPCSFVNKGRLNNHYNGYQCETIKTLIIKPDKDTVVRSDSAKLNGVLNLTHIKLCSGMEYINGNSIGRVSDYLQILELPDTFNISHSNELNTLYLGNKSLQ